MVYLLDPQVCVALLDLLWFASKSPAIILYPKTLPCDVRSNGSTVMVDCTARKLTDIPQGIPRDTTNLTLTINHIPKLNSSSFGSLENLTELDMRCNCLPIKIGPKDHICTESVMIEDNAFHALTKLRALYLDGNQLGGIPEGLPPDLRLLSLEVNHIYNISHANFSKILHLEKLYLGQNCYYRNPCNFSYQIESGAFLQLNNLTLLSLKSNNLSFIPHLLPTSLKELYLYNNNIDKVTENDFRNLTNLETLDISGNCPRCYNAPFPCTPCQNNSPLQISKSAFKTLAKLKTLRLHSNSLKIVLREWFSGTKELRVLDLSSNYLARDIGFTDFPRFMSKLEDLDLSFNYELQRYPQTLKLSKEFSKLTSLKILRIKGYVFQQLEEDSIDPLKPLQNLEVIDLGTNFIKITNLSILMELRSFKIINLAENKISAPSDRQNSVGVPGGEKEPLLWSPMSDNYKNHEAREIQYFRYDEYARSCKNKDKELGIPMSFAKRECTQFGKTLDVSRNNIFFLNSRFLNLSEVRCLNLSGNAMSQSLNGSEFTYLTNLKYLDFSLNRLDLRYATAFQELENLVVLDISKNNHYFESEGITRLLNFTKSLKRLKTLRMNHNKIWTSTNTELESESLEKLEFVDNRLDLLWRDGDTRFLKYFQKLQNLRELDISHNNLNFIPHQVFLSLPNKLSVLYVKNNKLKSFAWEELQFLQSLQVLDLSGNSLSTVPSVLSNCTKTLKTLILKGNQIRTLTPDFLKDAHSITYLDISFNHINHVEISSFPDDVINHMEKLLLHNNDFVCLCNITSFVTWLNGTTVQIPKLATDVTCAVPEAKRGQPVISVDLLACQHNDLSIMLYMLNASLVLSLLILFISSHLFLWDVWYIYHFCRAKLKGYRRFDSQSALYDAFVIYDKADPAVLEWVMKEMCIHLEKRGDRRLTLCLEERDWIPGCPLIDNLSQSIHKSKRTVFVLTNKYIQSGNFKTAFYMAQQRLMDEKNDVIVLILLEEVPCNSRYLRLRKRLYKRSVLKWPTNPRAQPYFWFGLRSVLATEGHKQYNNLFKETLISLASFYYFDRFFRVQNITFLGIFQNGNTCKSTNVTEWIMSNVRGSAVAAKTSYNMLTCFVVHLQTAMLWMQMLLLCACCWPAASKPKWMLPQFPCDVISNNQSQVTFDCRGRKLKYVPEGITSNATELMLSENRISQINLKSFSNLINLARLNLNWANKKKLMKIDNDTFQTLNNLQWLQLSGNCLTAVPVMLPRSLTELELNNNRLLNLDKNSFTRLRNVTRLWLSKNCYYWNPCGRHMQISRGSFAVMTKLQNLDLSFNNLTQVPKGLPSSLQMLKLGTNQIEYISKNDFRGMKQLKILKIQGNCRRCQNAPFPCVPCKNGSLAVHPDAFRDLTRLETLNLAGNSMTYMNPSWFQKLKQLKELLISFNFLRKAVTGEATFLTYLPKLEKIDLSFNFDLKSYPKTVRLSEYFSSLVSLRTLHLEGLVFQEIGADTLRPLYNLKNLSTLNLGTNFIMQLNSTIFRKFSHMKMIYLGENRLHPISVNALMQSSDGYNERSDYSVSTFTMPHPKEFEISHSFVKQECFDSGRVLSLNSNNLFFISPQQFNDYINITCLNLSGNGFSSALNGTEFSSIPTLTYLDLSYNRIDLAFDYAFSELKNLQVLDISHNSHYFTAYAITHNLNFLKNLPVLRVLNMSHNLINMLTTKQMYSKSLTELQFTANFLGTLWKERDHSYINIFTHLTNLTILDISENSITKLPKDVYDSLPRNLIKLSLSHNSLKDFMWDKLSNFPKLQTLDLSFNCISDVKGIDSNATYMLTYLDLSHNHIFHLDDGFMRSAKSLRTLSLSHNKLSLINQSTFSSGHDKLLLGGNPFQCTCDMLDFILWIETSGVHIPRLATDVTCDGPEKEKGRALILFDINQCVNGSVAFLLYIVTLSFIIVFMFVVTVAHLFYWDASYTLHYVKAKLKGYRSLNSCRSIYDVFVTYDTKDPHVSEWVMKHLRVKLEDEGEKHLPLCLEQRDWIPGVPLMDNLIQSIRDSRKTMFVLTEGYVKTGVFRLAMYLAHQRLLDENMDVIVLLMLEPVMQHSYFLRLRKRLCGKSVVEWPKTPAAEPWFWQNLRNVIRVDNQVMYNKTYSMYFTSR
uniref:uncharacterized protein tlr7 n=1 Tax=Doryrhamphus excisus TaxID=161450 RepID=UPI0025AE600B|nr:uncharacterized protein tlr7 [Doryrhamphus excisus]